ncbi:LysR family transcriptional regulator [Brevibacillus agri]|uniref:LysR family transcriptional regulator n=1 Tax=Brevibacillus agri TaxID=51101 RepID=UPI002868344F|nr:LysR family transcriptional regulator [Brevibacillus agri]
MADRDACTARLTSSPAARLHIAQPPLSRQIRQLEEEVGVQLFFRTNRHVELTSAGKAFLEKAYQLLDLVEEACDTARMAARAEHGKLLIGFTGTAHHLLPIVTAYRETYPNVSLNLQLLGTTAQVQALHDKRIDVGFLTQPVNSDQLIVKPYFSPEIGAILPEQHPLAQSGEPIRITDLADESFVITPRQIGPGFYDTVTKVCHQAGFSPKITVETHDMQTVIELVSSGMGVSLGPRLPLAGKSVAFRALSDVSIRLEAGVAYRMDEKSELVHSFLELFFRLFPHETQS